MPRRLAVIAAVASLAVALAPSSSKAHDLTSKTSLTRFKVPAGKTERGDKIVLLGRLRSADPTCHAGIVVGLYRADPAGDRRLARDVTDGDGEYLFQRRPRRHQTIYVKFEGFVHSVADHSHNCGGSLSRQVNIRILR